MYIENFGRLKKEVVPQVGFEPTRPKAEDFESTKSTRYSPEHMLL